jgi:hypothetical protein
MRDHCRERPTSNEKPLLLTDTNINVLKCTCYERPPVLKKGWSLGLPDICTDINPFRPSPVSAVRLGMYQLGEKQGGWVRHNIIDMLFSSYFLFMYSNIQ